MTRIVDIHELKEYIKTHVPFDWGREDDDGNEYSFRIYDENGELYRIDFCNDCPVTRWDWDRQTLIDHEYEIRHVKKKVEMIETITYEDY